MLSPVVLRYVGDGSFLVNVPGRDIRADEADAFNHDELVASGLYRHATEEG